MIGPHAALIHTMVLVSAADRDMTDREIVAMEEIIRYLPAFEEFDRSTVAAAANECAGLLEREDGLDVAIQQIKRALPKHLRETAYALACDVVAADGEASQEELRLLEMLRHALDIDRLIAAGIERGARARFTRL